MSLEALEADLQLIKKLRTESECLFSAQQVDEAIARMAEQISSVLADSDPLLLCIMNGGLILTGKLATLLDFPLQIDYLHATRYRGETRGAELNWLAYPRERLVGRDILLVDDILDEGNTLAAVKAYCIERGAKSVYTAVLADKKHARRLPGISADCAGLQLEDKFVFGSGLDYKGYLRNVAGIYAIDESALSKQP